MRRITLKDTADALGLSVWPTLNLLKGMRFLLARGQLPRASARATQVWVEPHTYGGGQIRHYSTVAEILFVDVYCSHPIAMVFKTTNRTPEIAVGWLVFMAANRTCLGSVFFVDILDLNSLQAGFVLYQILIRHCVKSRTFSNPCDVSDDNL